MAENVRPPVAIRIVRPYETEDELLENELETIGKTSVVLIGAHPRPTGVILRFEVTLASGATVLRGEGRVLAHKENAFRGQSGLTLRFTRLDPRSKAVVDRATALREPRTASEREPGMPSRPPPPPMRAEGAIAEALTQSTPDPPIARDSSPLLTAPAPAPALTAIPAPSPSQLALGLTPPPMPVAITPPEPATAAPPPPIEDRATPIPTPVTSIPGEVRERFEAESESTKRTAAPPPTALTISAPPLARKSRSSGAARPPAASSSSAEPEESPVVSAPASSASTLEAPADRADLLARLRERAAKLPAERVEEILSARR